MAEQKDPPRPHGDPLRDGAPDANPEDNRAQRQSDASPDLTGTDGRGREESDREGGRGSDANGLAEGDEAEGEKRKRLYRDGAELVSGMD